MYVAGTRNSFTPASRRRLFERFRGLEIPECPFVNLPEGKVWFWETIVLFSVAVVELQYPGDAHLNLRDPVGFLCNICTRPHPCFSAAGRRPVKASRRSLESGSRSWSGPVANGIARDRRDRSSVRQPLRVSGGCWSGLGGCQNMYFKPNWISRGATEVRVTTPKFAVPKFVPGLENCG